MIQASALSDVDAPIPLALLSQAVVEQAPIAISMTNLQGQILYVNQAFSQITGHRCDALLGQTHATISYRTTPRAIYAELWQTVLGGQVWRGRLINRKANGDRYLADVTIAPLVDEQGAVTHFLGMHRDISEAHMLNTRLANQRLQLEAVINAAPQAMALLEPNGEVVLDNLAYKTLRADLGDEPAALVMAAAADSHGPIALERQGRHGLRYFSATLDPLEAADPSADTFFAPAQRRYQVLTISEQTRERRRQEQRRLDQLQLLTAQSELAHALQESLQAALVQLQQPLNLIRAALNVMGEHRARCLGVGALEMALESGKEASERLRRALPERPLEAQQPVNLNQILHDTLALTTPRALALGITIRWQPQSDLPAVQGQPGRLRLACKQLLENALEAIDRSRPAQRDVLLTTLADEDEISLLVDDSGPGIPSADRNRIFEPFFSTKPLASEGVRGLGLSLVQQIVNEHAATLSIEDSPLGGCRFILRLPRLAVPRR